MATPIGRETVLIAAGFVGALALSPSLPVCGAAWLVIGLGMARGLYDPAFAALGRLYGSKAHSLITLVTSRRKG